MSPENETPIACTLSTEALAERRHDLLAHLCPHIQEAKPLDSGYAWRFDGSQERWTQLSAFVQAERQCCSFLRFQLTAEPENGPLWLEATGPAGTRAFLDALFAAQ